MAHPDDLRAAYERLAEHFRGETPFFESEVRVRHKDGHWVWIHDRGRVAQRAADGSPAVMSGTHQDITVRKLAEEALETALRRAEQATAAKSMFLANMSHEIRTPLNGVLGMAEVLHRATTDPAQKRMVGMIRDSGEVLLNVINDILDFSKIEAGRLDLEAIPFQPAELARRVESLHALKAAEKGVSFEVLTSTGADVARRGDPHRIQQVLHNLVGNAIKFTQTGEVVVTFSCAPAKPLVIEVRDTGIGMSPEQTARIFEEFTQADSSTTRRFGGAGLGMAIVRRIVEAMDGEIVVESRLGEGTRVRVALPLEALGRDEMEPRTPECGHGAPERRLRVLAADDNEINRLVLGAMLDELGVATTMVDGGREAVAACENGTFDLLLLDISMPEMDGMQALAAIRASEAARGAQRAPAVAVTANALTHQVADYLKGGFDAHVAKPIHPDALRDAICVVTQAALA